MCFPAPAALHGFPWAQRTLCFHCAFIKCSNTRFLLVSLQILHGVLQHDIRAAQGCACGSRFQRFRFMVIKILHFSCTFVLKKAAKRLPLGARQSSEAQDAEDPPSFYTCKKMRIKTLPAGMAARGLGFSDRLSLGLHNAAVPTSHNWMLAQLNIAFNLSSMAPFLFSNSGKKKCFLTFRSFPATFAFLHVVGVLRAHYSYIPGLKDQSPLFQQSIWFQVRPRWPLWPYHHCQTEVVTSEISQLLVKPRIQALREFEHNGLLQTSCADKTNFPSIQYFSKMSFRYKRYSAGIFFCFSCSCRMDVSPVLCSWEENRLRWKMWWTRVSELYVKVRDRQPWPDPQEHSANWV